MTHHHRESDIPDWDGRPETWEDFRIRTTAYVRQADPWKEGQQISKIISKMGANPNSKPWKLIQALSDEERDKLISKSAFLEFLRLHLLESAIPELGRAFRNWIKIRRENKESMRLYTMRHRQVLSRMEKALNESKTSTEVESKLTLEVDKERLNILTRERNSMRTPQRSPAPSYTGESPQRSRRQPSGPNTPEPPRPRVWGRAKGESRQSNDWNQEEEEDEDVEGTPWAEINPGSPTSPQREKESGTWWQGKWWAGWESWTESQVKHVPKERLGELAETIAKIATNLDVDQQHLISTLINQVAARWRDSIIPDTLLGYHLLISSQLSPSERSTIISTTQMAAGPAMVPGTTVASGISLSRVENALLQSWQDKELMERDDREARKASKRGTTGSRRDRAFAADDISDNSEDSDKDPAETNTLKGEEGSESNMSDADANALEDLSDPEVAEEWAMALQTRHDSKRHLRTAKRTYAQAKDHVRTLRKKRWGKVNSVLGKKVKRTDFRRSSSHPPNPSSSSSAETRLCFKCGKKGHIAADCKDASGSKSSAGKIHCIFTLGTATKAMADSSESESDSDKPEDKTSAKEGAAPASSTGATGSTFRPPSPLSPPSKSRSHSRKSESSSTNTKLLRKKAKDVELLKKKVEQLELATKLTMEENELKMKMKKFAEQTRSLTRPASRDRERRGRAEERKEEKHRSRKERTDKSREKVKEKHRRKEKRREATQDSDSSSERRLKELIKEHERKKKAKEKARVKEESIDEERDRGRRRARSRGRSTERRPRPTETRSRSFRGREILKTPPREKAPKERVILRTPPRRPPISYDQPARAVFEEADYSPEGEPPHKFQKLLSPRPKRAAGRIPGIPELTSRTLAEKGPAPPPSRPPALLMNAPTGGGYPYQDKGKGKGAEIEFDYDADKGPYQDKGKGKGGKSAREWKLWRQDRKEKKKDPEEGIKYRDSYEEPVPFERMIPTANIQKLSAYEQLMSRRMDKDRYIRRMKRVRDFGSESQRRINLRKKGKLLPKRTRKEIICCPIWPRKMKKIFTLTKRTEAEDQILQEIMQRKEEVRTLLQAHDGVKFCMVRGDDGTDEEDPHWPTAVQNLTDTEEHWEPSPSPERSAKVYPEGFYPSSTDEDERLNPRMIPRSDKLRQRKVSPLVRASTKIKEEQLPGRPDRSPEETPSVVEAISTKVEGESAKDPEGPTTVEEEKNKTIDESASAVSAETEIKEEALITMLEEIQSNDVLSMTAGKNFEAIIDSGASASIMSLQTAESLSAHAVAIDPTRQRRFRTAGGEVIQAISVATFELEHLGSSEFHIIDNESTPTLIGMTSLENAVLNFQAGTLSRKGKIVKLSKNSNGHYVINLE